MTLINSVGLKSYAKALLGCGAKRPVSAFADKEQDRNTGIFFVHEGGR